MNKYDVVAIIGPTASGKTALSIQLAKAINGEIINGDAMQVYKRLDIGTAKITKEEMDGIPHHLIDIKEPTESFSVAEYQQLVRDKIDEIQSRGKMPIIVGGTGLYIQSVLYDFQFTEQPIDEEARKKYYDDLAVFGPEEMHRRLAVIDPKSAEAIHPNNTRRVIRALEMAELANTSRSDEKHQRGEMPLYNHLIIGIDMDRTILYERINKRVDMMMASGLEEEARSLYEEGIRDTQSVKAIGYKELFSYFNGYISKEEAVEQIKQNSRRYAKRQLTYFRNKMDIEWIGHDFQLVLKKF